MKRKIGWELIVGLAMLVFLAYLVIRG